VGVRDDADEVTYAPLSRRDQRQHEGSDTRVRRVTVHVDCSFVGGGRESAALGGPISFHPYRDCAQRRDPSAQGSSTTRTAGDRAPSLRLRTLCD
jgi:hypothetical protein